ncbi:MAG: hypothetical protein DME20_03445 [Verrucomicrobia bacterium]|nr:MAG: hypothetical protein DME20_03445 [Verrucomicrobiota bacterium]
MGEISSEKAEWGDAARSTRLWLLWFATTPTLLVGRSWWAHLDSNPNGEKILVKTYRRKFSRLFLDGATGEQKSLTPKRPSSPSKRPQKSATVSLFLRGLHVMENFNSILQ